MELESSPELSPYLLKNVKRTGNILGIGSFGSVEEVTFNEAPCAGKKMHDVLMQSKDDTKRVLMKKLVDECKLMSEIKHPNIVQFFGLCFFEKSTYPTIVMEKLNSSLDATLLGHSCIPLALKNMFMQDIAKGLNYLHTQSSPIIHGDLTAKNVLLTSSMTAKLADLGNAHIIRSHGIPTTFSQIPGTLVYMAPEALQVKPICDTSLDMFSFGHLSLFIVLQAFPGDLLTCTYTDPSNPRGISARTEVERRKEYLDQCIPILGFRNPIIQFIEDCLNNNPQMRPTASQILDQLLKTEKAEKQVYGQIRRQLNFSPAEAVSGETEYAYVQNISPETSGKLAIPSQQMLQQIRCGEPMVLDKLETTKQGRFKKERQNYWEQYVFRIDSSYLRYYGDLKKKPLGEIELSSVTSVKKVPHRYNYPFTVYFDGKHSPWHLRARTGDVRNCWMENILVSSSFQAEPISTAASEYKEVGHFLESNKSATLPSSVKYGTPAANLPMKPPVKANTCGRNVKLQPSITGAKADEPIYDELFLQKKEHNCTKKPDPTIHNVEQIPAEYMYAVPLLDQYKEFSDEQIKELLSAFQNILKKRGEEPEQMERPPQFGLSASIVSGRNSPTKPDGYTIIDTGDKKDSVDIPPPVPPKKKRGPNRVPPSEPNSDGNHFRDRVMAETWRSRSIRAIERYKWKLSKPIDPAVESGRKYEQWARASTLIIEEEQEVLMPQELFLNKSSIKNMKLIAAGYFGKTYRGELVLGGAAVPVTAKELTNRKGLQQEVVIMCNIMHPNIVRYYGLLVPDNYIVENMIVLESTSNRDLSSFLQCNPRPVTKLLKYMCDIVMGMHHLADLGLVHRDLAARNILVTDREECKVGDLGQIIEVPKDGDKTRRVTESRLPLRWCAPEYLRERKCSTASDVWSFGVVMWEMANPGRQPYENLSNEEVIQKITAGHTLIIPSDYPKDVQNVMKMCWSSDSNKRPSFLWIHINLDKANVKAKFHKRK